MLRVGRMVINESLITKVVSDDKTKSTIVHFQGGNTAKFKKHASAAWNYFKTSSRQVAAPSTSSSNRRPW